MFAIAVAAALSQSPVPADPAAAEIGRLERQWGEAFVKRDFDVIDRIVAPGFRLVAADADGNFQITPRSRWMANARAFTHHAFEVETVDVNRAGDTAVASAQGLWTVSFRRGQPAMPVRFFVTDTWVLRNGEWQVIHRYSHRLPNAPWPPARPQQAPAK